MLTEELAILRLDRLNGSKFLNLASLPRSLDARSVEVISGIRAGDDLWLLPCVLIRRIYRERQADTRSVWGSVVTCLGLVFWFILKWWTDYWPLWIIDAMEYRFVGKARFWCWRREASSDGCCASKLKVIYNNLSDQWYDGWGNQNQGSFPT